MLFKTIILSFCFLKTNIVSSMVNSDELVAVVPYNYIWNVWYNEESSVLRSIFDSHSILSIEHFGSTSVSGLSAKPVIDILVGLNKFELQKGEIEGLRRLGYIFVEKSPYCERFYFKKRCERSFNLSIVLFSSDTWNDCICVRDYLRAHPDMVQKYTEIKQDAILSGYTTISKYSNYKRKFVEQLLAEARLWRPLLSSLFFCCNFNDVL